MTPRSRGFTLLEVLIALAVLSLAMAALISTGSQQAANLDHLRNKTLAHWVAMNTLAELQIEQAWPKAGSSRREAELAEREWHVTVISQNTDDKDLRRIEIEVRHDKDDEGVLTRLVSLMAKPDETSP